VQITNGPIRLADYPALWRQKITRRIIQIFPSDGAGFARALLLGDTEGLTYQQNRAFQVSGLRHVVGVN
jgi:predicted membrane metal-binding protein